MDANIWFDDIDQEFDDGYCSDQENQVQENQVQQQQQQQDVFAAQEGMELAYVDQQLDAPNVPQAPQVDQQLDVVNVVPVLQVEEEQVQQQEEEPDFVELIQIQHDFLKEFDDLEQLWIMHNSNFRFNYYLFLSGNEWTLRTNAEIVLRIHDISHKMPIHILQAFISALIEEHFYITHMLDIKYNYAISYHNFHVLRQRIYFYDREHIKRIIKFQSPNVMGKMIDAWFFLRAIIDNLIMEYHIQMMHVLPFGTGLHFWPFIRFPKTGFRPNDAPQDVDEGIW